MQDSLLQHVWFILLSGGPIMVPLGLLSLILYRDIIGLFLFVKNVPLDKLMAEEEHHREANLGGSSSPGNRNRGVEDTINTDEIRLRFHRIVESRLRYSNALLVAAPLLGLLGTVMGMLHTFRGLALQAGQETASTVADGVARALITTQSGLMIAIPALFVMQWVRRIFQKRELQLLEQRVGILKTQIGENVC